MLCHRFCMIHACPSVYFSSAFSPNLSLYSSFVFPFLLLQGYFLALSSYATMWMKLLLRLFSNFPLRCSEIYGISILVAIVAPCVKSIGNKDSTLLTVVSQVTKERKKIFLCSLPCESSLRITTEVSRLVQLLRLRMQLRILKVAKQRKETMSLYERLTATLKTFNGW